MVDSKTADVSSLLAIDPSAVDIVCLDDEREMKMKLGRELSPFAVNRAVVDDSRSDPMPSSSHSFLSTPATSSASAAFLRQLPFVSMFRGSANYIANHRGTTAVYHIPGGLVDSYAGNDGSSSNSSNMFRDLMNDVALTWLLGMKIVLVVGCRHQIERRLGMERMRQLLGGDDNRLHGLRVTDEETLRIVKEEAGYVRFEVERQLARSLRVQGTGTTTASSSTSTSSSSPMSASGAGLLGGSHHGSSESSSASSAGGGYYDGNVVSGNFYSAQPFGILDGVDYSAYFNDRM
jgi:amino-acid N-acetyltransferase